MNNTIITGWYEPDKPLKHRNINIHDICDNYIKGKKELLCTNDVWSILFPEDSVQHMHINYSDTPADTND